MILQDLDSTYQLANPLKQQTDQEIEDFRQTTQSFLTESDYVSSDYFEEEIIRESKVQEIIRESKTQDNELLHYYKQHIKEIIKLQVFFRNINKKVALKKQAKKRKLVLEELLMTEKIYLKDLKLVINNVMLVSNYQKILPELEIDLAFRNIISIYNLNSQFYKELQNEYLKFTDTTIFGSIFLKYIPFFKIYFEYISDFQDNKIKSLREKYPQFNEHLIVLETANLFRGCTFEAFLIKPVQRLPKYSLLIKELVKYTWDSHPDYESLKLTQSRFHEVTNQINSLIGNILQNQALFDLQSKFFDFLNINIVESTRKFLINESVCYSKKGKEQEVNLYLCSDMIILSKRSQKVQIQERLICFYYFDEKSTFNYYKDKSLMIVLTCQEEALMLTCSDHEQKDKIVQQLEYIQNNIIIRSQTIQVQEEVKEVNPIRVFVNNITRGQSKILFKTYAKYQLIIKTTSMEFLTWTRHKKLVKIQQLIQQILEDEQFNKCSCKKIKLFNEIKITKSFNKNTYDQRKIVIEQFLEALLNSYLITQNQDLFLKLLKLPQDFFQIIKSNNQS